MSCPSVEELELYATGRLRAEARAGLEGHVAACAACPGRMAEVRRGLELAGRLAGPAGSSDMSTEDQFTSKAIAAAASSVQPAQAWDIPDYAPIRVCGRGAYGVVWVARDRVGAYRALKIIDLAKLEAQNVPCRELKALETYCRRVQRHRNLIDVFHVGQQGHSLYYTMELADDYRTRKPVRGDFLERYEPLTLQAVMARGASARTAPSSSSFGS
jgi:hypothetical protein